MSKATANVNVHRQNATSADLFIFDGYNLTYQQDCQLDIKSQSLIDLDSIPHTLDTLCPMACIDGRRRYGLFASQPQLVADAVFHQARAQQTFKAVVTASTEQGMMFRYILVGIALILVYMSYSASSSNGSTLKAMTDEVAALRAQMEKPLVLAPASPPVIQPSIVETKPTPREPQLLLPTPVPPTATPKPGK